MRTVSKVDTKLEVLKANRLQYQRKLNTSRGFHNEQVLITIVSPPLFLILTPRIREFFNWSALWLRCLVVDSMFLYVRSSSLRERWAIFMSQSPRVISPIVAGSCSVLQVFSSADTVCSLILFYKFHLPYHPATVKIQYYCSNGIRRSINRNLSQYQEDILANITSC